MGTLSPFRALVFACSLICLSTFSDFIAMPASLGSSLRLAKKAKKRRSVQSLEEHHPGTHSGTSSSVVAGGRSITASQRPRKRGTTDRQDGSSPSKRASLEINLANCLEALVPAASRSSVPLQAATPGTRPGTPAQFEFEQHMLAMGGLPSVGFLEALRSTNMRKRGTTVHQDDVWGPERYPVEVGDLDRLVNYCARLPNQCPNWPTGATWEEHSLLILQYFEQELIYDFTHGFARLAEYSRKESSNIHTFGRIITRLRQSTQSAPFLDSLRFLQLPRRMRQDCPSASDNILPDSIDDL